MERGESSTARAAGPPQPWIFLSHSGWQKDFVTHLHRELLHVHHHPFFDMDPIRSLPPGLDYSLRIFQACHGCKLGVVVLSHEYMESLWPMLELQHLLLYNRDRPVYPLFYQLEPADLIKEKNLERWKQSWSEKAPRWQTRMQELQEMMGGEVQINLDTTFWPEMLKMLQYRSGQVRKVIHASNERTQYQSEYDYVHAIVSNICSLLPPPRPYLLDGAIKGHERMMEEVASLFDQQAGSIVVGMHGIGGSGKSTLCKAMANYYSQHFSGRSWWLELPSNATENAILVNRIKDLLPYMSFGQDTVNRVSTLDQAMLALAEGLQRNKVFLALDNVWDLPVVGLEIAKKILSLAEYGSGSRVLVTSRSKEILKRLGVIKAAHVPSMSEAEAVEALKSYSCFSDSIPPEHLTRLARSCFFEEQCHPLLLKLKGKELRERGRARFSSQEWKCLIDGLQVADDDVDYVDSEDQVVQVLLKSFDTLPRRLQNIFTDLLTCRKDEDMDVDVNCEWLAMLQSGGVGKAQVMKHQILTLEFHGLLEISTGLFSLIRIHDLYKRVAMCKSANQQEYFLNEQEYASGHNILFTTYKYMHLVSCKMGISIIKQLFHIINTKYGLPNLQVLWILGGGVHGIRSNMAALRLRNINMEVLRILRLEALLELEEVKGWEGVPNLESLHLEELDSLRSIGHLGILRKLESLVLRGCSRLQVRALVGTQLKLVKVGDGLPNLQVLEFSGNLQLVEVGPLPHDAFPALQSLDLHGCSFLKSFPDLKLDCLSSLNLKGCCRMKRLEGSICSLTALEELRLDSCSKIESIPDLSNVRRLRRLSASDCTSLKRLEGSFCSLKALEELNLRGCQELQSIPDLSNLLRLRTLDACNCVSLREGIIPGLGVLPALQDLFLSAISSGLVGGDSELCQLPAMLQRLVLTTGARRLDSLSRLTSLQKLRLMDCSSLTDVPTLAALTSLQCLWLSGCPNLSHLPDLKHITGLKFVKITGAPLLSEEYVRQRLNLSETRLYLSQTQRQFYSWITESLAFVDLERGENEALRRPLSIFSWELGKREST